VLSQTVLGLCHPSDHTSDARYTLHAVLFQSLYGAGWGNFANYETRSKKLLSDQLKDSPTGLCSKSFFSRAVCPNDS